MHPKAIEGLQPHMMPEVPGPIAVVTGATGAIGPALVERLLLCGYRVRVLMRHSTLPTDLADKVEVHHGSITDRLLLAQLVAGADVVFHLAAKLHINNPAPELQAEYQAVNVDGTRILAEASQAAGVGRLVFFSTISVYGPTELGKIWDECSSPQPRTLYAQTKHDAELVVLRARRGDSDEPLTVVLRLAAVYGPRVKGNYARLVSALRRGLFVPLGTGRNRRTLVYDQDVVTAAILAAEHPAAAGNIYNVTNGHIHTFNDIIVAICQALARTPPRYHLPVPPFRLLAAILEDGLRLLGRESPIVRGTIQKLLEDVAVSGEKIQRELQFRPAFDLTTGWEQNTPEMISSRSRVTKDDG